MTLTRLTLIGPLLLFAICAGSVGSPQLTSVVFCGELTQTMAPRDQRSEFAPDERINLSLRFDGRPRRGRITVRFLSHDVILGESTQDLSSLNEPILLSAGEETTLGFWLDHREPLPVGGYRAAVLIDGELIGEEIFWIVAPEAGVETRLIEAHLLNVVDQGREDGLPVLGRRKQATITGRVDLGRYSWIQVAYYYEHAEGSELQTDRHMATQDGREVSFSLGSSPEGGWAPGPARAYLLLDGRMVQSFRFFVE